MSSDIIFISAEASGDDLSVDVILELKARDPELTVSAIGGPGLARAGLESPFDISALSIVGFAEALKIYTKVVKLADDVTDYVIEQNPEAVVLVDSWGFSLRVAQRLRKRGPQIRLIKLIGPQVWATRAGRAKTLAETVDHLLCIHDFELPYYERYGLDCSVIGNPALSRMPVGDASRFREKYQIAEDKPILLVLPGSRSSEIKRVAPTLVEAARKTVENYRGALEVCVLVSSSIREQLKAAGLAWPENTHFVERPEDKADLMSASTLALACSGTVTTELATQNCPMIVGYRVGAITWFLAKNFLFKSKYITLANVAMDEEVVPEYLQDEFTPECVSQKAVELLSDDAKRSEQKRKLEQAIGAMGWGQPPSHVLAAERILSLLH